MPGTRLAGMEPAIQERWASADYDGAARLLLDAYGPQVLGYLVRTMGDEADACEVFSRFCEFLWKALPSFEGRSSFKTWAYRLATYGRTRFWQDPYRRRTRHVATAELERIEQEVRSQTLRWLRTDVKDAFARIRQKLNVEEQTILTLRVDKDLSWPEIVEVLRDPDDSPNQEELKAKATALRQRFQRIKEKIRVLAREEGLMDESQSDGFTT